MDKKERREEASAAIEAVASLTIFMIAIMTILSFINICRAQAAVSIAMDAVAKEMSQYAYFYHIIGLDEVEQKLGAKVEEDRKKLDDIAGGTSAIYKVFETLSSDQVSSQDITDLVNGAADMTKNADEKAKQVAENKITMGNAASKIDQMMGAVDSIKDPIQFLKSVATIGAMEGSSFLKSQLIAAPLAKLLIKKHFQVDGMDEDSYLRSLNIDGMNALNFKMSAIFAPSAPNDIHLVCYYQMTPIHFFNFEFGTVTLCKESVTRAWLGGDREYKADEGKSDGAGVWDMGSLQYGKYIVNAEKEKLEKQGCYDVSGSGADAFNPSSNTWIHIRSMDIYSDSYLSNPNAVKNALRSEYSKLMKAANANGDTISVKDGEEKKELSSPKDSRRRYMIIVIPQGEQTEAFEAGLRAFLEEVEGDASFQYEVIQGYGTSPKNRPEKAEEISGEVSGEGGTG